MLIKSQVMVIKSLVMINPTLVMINPTPVMVITTPGMINARLVNIVTTQFHVVTGQIQLIIFDFWIYYLQFLDSMNKSSIITLSIAWFILKKRVNLAQNVKRIHAISQYKCYFCLLKEASFLG